MSSPEFEFWPVDANPAASPCCADELFADGVLLPLPILLPKVAPDSCHHRATPEPEQEDASLAAVVASSAAITSPAPPAAAGGSKRWTDIFAKKPAEDKKTRKDGGGGSRKPAASTGGGGGGGGSELNINIWPFSRSRSAGGGGGSSKPRPPPRKASSAPCSRSNSRGEAAAAAPPPPPRRWAPSPGRGVPVGRSSPVWQIKRPATKHTPADQPADRRAHQKDKRAAAGGGKKTGAGSGGMRGINLSVNSCIGYRHQVSCRRVDAGAGARSPGVVVGGLFGIKGFFSKKVH